MRAPLAAGQRTAIVHLAFCPQFAKAPELTVEQIEDAAVLGRYGLWPPGQAGDPLKRRMHVVVLGAQHDLVGRLEAFDYDPTALSNNPQEAAAQVDRLCKQIEERFDGVVRFAPIPVRESSPTP